ncbi:AraC family transcriptional regulator [Comamonas sp. JNW]|uniref:helix-turn-helix domain-containing protein n=1 Tax=unclassified Comamonas TaxID=2638500 RepID=UPI000DE778BD|nr:AraC family transcriptional regulator [Comamonas sp. JNW]PWB16842.1 cupin [Comamonas sp. JNW]
MADHHHHRLLAPDYSVRHYEGEQQAHSHDHVQLLYALAGRMELEVDGKAAYVDTASGVVIPAGATHAYLAQKGSALAVVDVPDGADWAQMRRFAAPPRDWLATHASALTVAQAHVAWVQQSPALLLRRVLDVQAITAAVRADLAGDWRTPQLAALAHLSAQRFHVRWQELTGSTPQQWLRDLRLTEASQALAAGQPLETTALRCGYSTASALAYALRRDRGVGSRSLRKRGGA